MSSDMTSRISMRFSGCSTTLDFLGWRKFWPRDFTYEEVLEALDRLVRRGLAKPLEYNPVKRELVTVNRPVDVRTEGGSLWYKVEQSALDLWNAWKSPKESVD
jgi:hypothetical protein